MARTYGGSTEQEWRERYESFGPDTQEGYALLDALNVNAALLKALKALRADSWRHTVDWGPREERDVIEAEADAAIALAESTN